MTTIPQERLAQYHQWGLDWTGVTVEPNELLELVRVYYEAVHGRVVDMNEEPEEIEGT